MSAYLTLGTPMLDRDLLLGALQACGFGPGAVEVHEEPVQLEGYAGDAREQRAHIVIRRRFISPSSNDVGFVATPTGFRLIVSAYDRARFGGEWLTKLSTNYAQLEAERAARLHAEALERERERKRQLVEAQRATIEAKARKLGYSVNAERQGDGVRLVLVRRTY